jgi:hypothetical protein
MPGFELDVSPKLVINAILAKFAVMKVTCRLDIFECTKNQARLVCQKERSNAVPISKEVPRDESVTQDE